MFSVLIRYSWLTFVACASLFIASFSASAQPNYPFIDSIDGKPLGYITSILESESGVFVGSENGLYRIQGNEYKFIDGFEKYLDGGFVSSIGQLDDDHILVSVFGGGLYSVNFRTHSIQPYEIFGIPSSQVWNIDVFGNRLAVSTVNNAYVLDIQTKEIVLNLNHIGVERYSEIISVQLSDGMFWLIDREKALFSVDLSTSHLQKYDPRETGFHYTEITSFLAEDDTVFIGSDLGLIKFDRLSKEYSLYSDRPKGYDDNETKQFPVYHISRGPDGKIWVGAEKLYWLNQQTGEFEVPWFVNQSLVPDNIEIVTQILYSPTGYIFLVDTQRGLLRIPNSAKSTVVLNSERVPFAGHITSRIQYKSGYLIASEGKVFRASESGEVIDVINVGEPDSYHLVRTENRFYAVKGTGEFFELYPERSIALPLKSVDLSYGENISGVITLQSGELVIRLESSHRSGLFLVVENALKKLVDGSIAAFAAIENGVVFTKHSNGVFIYSDGQIKKLSSNVDFSLCELNSVQLSSNGERIWIGTSSGIYEYSYLNSSLKQLNNTPPGIINSIAEVDSGLFATTSKGLFFYDLKKQSYHLIDETFGVSDRSFEFNSILKNEHNVLVLGDKQTYVLDVKHLLSNFSAVYEHRVNISAIRFFDNESRQFETLNIFGTNKSTTTIAREHSWIEINVNVNKPIYSDLFKIEYRLINYSDEWVSQSHSIKDIEFPSLDAGRYKLEIRVNVDGIKESFESSAIEILVPAPFYLSIYAYMVYFLFPFSYL